MLEHTQYRMSFGSGDEIGGTFGSERPLTRLGLRPIHPLPRGARGRLHTDRAGILSVDKGQGEAAMALGLTPGQRLRLVTLPQAFKNAGYDTRGLGKVFSGDAREDDPES